MRKRERKINRKIEGEEDIQVVREIYRRRGGQIDGEGGDVYIQMEREGYRYIDGEREIDRQMEVDRQIDGEGDRQIDTGRETEIGRQINRQIQGEGARQIDTGWGR